MKHGQHAMKEDTRKSTRRVAITAVAMLGISLAAPVTVAHAGPAIPECEATAFLSPITDQVPTGEVIDLLPDIGQDRSTTGGCVDLDSVNVESLVEESTPKCVEGEPLARAEPAPAASIQSVLDAATLAGVYDPDPTDSEALTADVDAIGVRVSIVDCISTNVVVDSTTPDTMLQEGQDREGAGPPSTLGVRRPALATDQYGKNVKDMTDGSNFGAVWFIYDADYRDKRGRVLIGWQNADITAGDKIKYTQALAYTNEPSVDSTIYRGSSPLGEQTIEASRGTNVSVKFTVEKKGAGSFEVGASRDFFIEYSKFGGGNLRDDAGNVWAHYGGYRHISKGHRRQNRAWSQAYGAIFKPGYTQDFDFYTTIRYQKS